MYMYSGNPWRVPYLLGVQTCAKQSVTSETKLGTKFANLGSGPSGLPGMTRSSDSKRPAPSSLSRVRYSSHDFWPSIRLLKGTHQRLHCSPPGEVCRPDWPGGNWLFIASRTRDRTPSEPISRSYSICSSSGCAYSPPTRSIPGSDMARACSVPPDWHWRRTVTLRWTTSTDFTCRPR